MPLARLACLETCGRSRHVLLDARAVQHQVTTLKALPGAFPQDLYSQCPMHGELMPDDW